MWAYSGTRNTCSLEESVPPPPGRGECFLHVPTLWRTDTDRKQESPGESAAAFPPSRTLAELQVL